MKIKIDENYDRPKLMIDKNFNHRIEPFQTSKISIIYTCI